MTRHMYFHREIDNLKKEMSKIGTVVEDRVRRACRLLETRDDDEAGLLMVTDWEIDEMEVEFEEECLKILALHQPVARDLRLVIAFIKINNEFERIADIAVNIAKRVQTINTFAAPTFSHDYMPMCEKVLVMLKKGLDALVTEDAGLARTLFHDDEEINIFRNQAYSRIVQELNQNNDQEDAAYLLNLYLVSRHLERLGDRVKNIAEEVIYLVEGEITRFSDDTP